MVFGNEIFFQNLKIRVEGGMGELDLAYCVKSYHTVTQT